MRRLLNLKFKTATYALALTAITWSGGAQAALVFNFSFIAGTSAQVMQGFVDAGNRWSNVFSDNVTLNMTVGTSALGSGILAQASSDDQLYSYNTFRTALTADRTSADDFTAVASLQSGPDFDVWINRTSDNPNGSGSATPYEDTTGANNLNVRISTANAKALGLAVSASTLAGCLSTCDAFIEFSNSFTYDFDGSNGITTGAFDFVGIATHELGHALGFLSGVDILDFNPGLSANTYTYVNSLDLFRYSTQSAANTAIDFTADTRTKYFSIDGGTTQIATFATGQNFGDGRQASHWQDGLLLGIMDPTTAPGELLAIVPNDIRALDVIGWTVAATPVPEPKTWLTMIAGFFAAAGLIRRAKRLILNSQKSEF